MKCVSWIVQSLAEQPMVGLDLSRHEIWQRLNKCILIAWLIVCMLLCVGWKQSGSRRTRTRPANGNARIRSVHKLERLRILHGGRLPIYPASSRGASRGSDSRVWHAESLACGHQEHGEALPPAQPAPRRSVVTFVFKIRYLFQLSSGQFDTLLNTRSLEACWKRCVFLATVKISLHCVQFWWHSVQKPQSLEI